MRDELSQVERGAWAAELEAKYRPVPREYLLDGDLVDESQPVHGEFGLTYASYLVLHRSLMQEMPLEWQRRFVQCVRDYWRVWDSAKVDGDFTVLLRDERGRFASDPLRNYRRPNHAAIEAARLKDDPGEGNR